MRIVVEFEVIKIAHLCIQLCTQLVTTQIVLNKQYIFCTFFPMTLQLRLHISANDFTIY